MKIRNGKEYQEAQSTLIEMELEQNALYDKLDELREQEQSIVNAMQYYDETQKALDE